MANIKFTPAGRLGNPDMDLTNDPRTSPELLKALAALGLDKPQPEVGLTTESSLSDMTAYFAASDDGFNALYEGVPNDLPGDENEPEVEQTKTTIKGVDGNDIDLHIVKRVDLKDKTIPCVVYTHGGGMVIINTVNKVHMRWLKDLALAGVVAIAIDFRNAFTKEKHNPFPAGLNDCAAGVKYIAEHKSELRISKIVIQGESGGGNLAIATTLKANKEGWVKSIDGVYACCPYISNKWGESKDVLVKELPSTVQNDGYFLGLKMMSVMGHYYTSSTDPLAWPLYVTAEDLKGLPPHFLAMDELDPLRDEGMAYFHKLTGAGVPATAIMNVGVTHGSFLIFRKALPGLHFGAVDSITGFAKRV